VTFSVLVRAAARRDIARAETWYLEHAPDHVARFLDQLAVTIRLIRDNPALFRPLRQDRHGVE
jgi:plasmid stabilization system protein ParE